MVDFREPAGTAPDRNLFGEVCQPIKDRRGRPSYAKNKENQELVALLRAAGWPHHRVARYLGCDEKTLRKHFSRELDAGADMIEGMALQVCLAKMKQGNSPAINRILDIVDNGRAAPPAPKEAKAPALGKKEILDREAANPPDGWGNVLQ